MTLATELAALAATFPNPAFEAHLATSRSELNATIATDSTQCLADLRASIVAEAALIDATAQVNAQTAVANSAAAAMQAQIDGLNAQIWVLTQERDAGGDTSGVPITQQISDGRAALVAARHHLLDASVDWTGAANASAGILFTIAAIPNGTAAAPRTIDYWPGRLYLQEDEVKVIGKAYTTVNLHGALVAPKPAIDLGLCTITASGSTNVTSAGGGVGPWTTADLIGRTFITKNQATKIQTETMILGVVTGGTTVQPFGSATTSYVFRLAKTALGNVAAQQSFAVSGGTPTTPGTIGTYPRVTNRKLWSFSGCTNCRVTGLGSGGVNARALGAVPASWNNPALLAVPNAEDDLQSQAAIGLFGSSFEVDHIEFDAHWGDVVRVGAYTSGSTTTEAISTNVHHCTGDRNAQNVLDVKRGNGSTLADCTFTNTGLSPVLLDPSILGTIVYGVNILRNSFGLSTKPCVAADVIGQVHGVNIKNNTGAGRPFDIRANAQDWASIPWQSWDSQANVGYTAPISNTLPATQTGPAAGSAASFIGINNLTYTGNTQDFLLVGGAAFMVHVIGEHITGTVAVSGNTGANAKAQGKINGTFTGGVAGGGRIGIPATGCIFGGAVDDLTTGSATVGARTVLESQLGFVLGGDRVYLAPGDNMDLTRRQALLDDDKAKGRVTVLSIAVPTGLNWYTLAADTTRLQNCANQLLVYSTNGYQIVVMLDHEPDVAENPGNSVAAGTQASRKQYAALQTAFFTRVRTTAPLVTRAMTFGGYKLYAGTYTVAQAIEFLPTDKTLLELIGDGPYNDADHAVSLPFATRVAKYYTLLTTYGKPGFIHEAGVSILAEPRVPWWNGAFASVKANPAIKMLLFFNSHVGTAPDPTHDYDVSELLPQFVSTTTGAGQSYFIKGGAVAPPPPPPPPSFGLKVGTGATLVDTSGAPFIVKGTSVAGPEYEPPQSALGSGFTSAQIWPAGFTPNQAFCDQMKAWKINTVRIPVNEWCWLGLNAVPGGQTMPASVSGTAYRTALINFIDLLGANGIYVFFEDHWNDASVQPGFDTTGTQNVNGQGAGPSQKTIDFWTSAANLLKGKPWVVFELFNETTGDYFWQKGGVTYNWHDGGPRDFDFLKYPETTIRTFTHTGFQALINAIRATGATNVIGLPGVGFEQEIIFATSPTIKNQFAGYGQTTVARHTDSYSVAGVPQMVLCAHWYPDSGSANNPARWDQQVNYVANSDGTGGANYTLPVVITEIAPTANDSPGKMGTTPMTTVGTSTLPGNLTVDAIPRVGSTNNFPMPTAAETAGLPYPTRARSITIAGIGTVVYADISGNTFTGCTGFTGSVPAGRAVTVAALDDPDRVGYFLNYLDWMNKRNAATAGARATRTGQRSMGCIAWNWAIYGQAGPQLIKNSYTAADPSNYGQVFKNWAPNG